MTGIKGKPPENLCLRVNIKPLAYRVKSQILAHPVFKMWIIQEPNQVALWNKRHFEEKKTEIMQYV
jgi:hypothetical protein